jgi:NADH-quinone oxidoreductase subunit M
MSFLQTHLLTLCIFTPLAFAALVAVMPAGETTQVRALTFLGMAVTFGLTVMLYLGFAPSGPEFQHEFRARWIDDVGISYHVGVDGLAVSLMLLTGFLGPWVVLGSRTYVSERTKEFHLALLVLQTAMLGALASMDIILFYIFWEAMLIPMYLLIGVWGSEERVKAAVKFFLYTMVGSLLMLLAILGLYFIAQPAGVRSFDFATLYNNLIAANAELSACVQQPDACGALSPLAQSLRTYGPWMFFAFALAFAIKVPMFPLHTWLPDAHVQAPMAGSMVLAGVMLKMGTFGFWRYAIPLFPVAAREARPFLAALAVVGIVYGALMCLAQRDIKKLIAYSSVSHLGYCMLGMLALTHEGATGSAYQMLNHGISTGALFLLFGLLYERRHSRLIADYGGIAKLMPMFTAMFLIVTFSSIAVPGTNGFVGEFLVLLGTFKSNLPIAMGVLASSAVILGAAYMLWMVQRVFFGPVAIAGGHASGTGSAHGSGHDGSALKDLNLRELIAVLPFILLVGVMGLWPQPFLERLAPSTDKFVARAQFGVHGAHISDEAVRVQAATLPDLPAGTAAMAPPPGQVFAGPGPTPPPRVNVLPRPNFKPPPLLPTQQPVGQDPHEGHEH